MQDLENKIGLKIYDRIKKKLCHLSKEDLKNHMMLGEDIKFRIDKSYIKLEIDKDRIKPTNSQNSQ